MDLKISIVDLEKNKTFRYILSTLLSIGNFLNGGDAKGFQIEYLAKVPEVKDTVAKGNFPHLQKVALNSIQFVLEISISLDDISLIIFFFYYFSVLTSPPM